MVEMSTEMFLTCFFALATLIVVVRRIIPFWLSVTRKKRELDERKQKELNAFKALADKLPKGIQP